MRGLIGAAARSAKAALTTKIPPSCSASCGPDSRRFPKMLKSQEIFWLLGGPWLHQFKCFCCSSFFGRLRAALLVGHVLGTRHKLHICFTLQTFHHSAAVPLIHGWATSAELSHAGSRRPFSS